MTSKPVRTTLASALSTALVAMSVAAAVPAAADSDVPAADTAGPTVTVKNPGADDRFRSASFKLYDVSKVDKVEINGVLKDLSNNTYSDVNGVKPGAFGAVEGKNTLVAYDTLGNTTTFEFTLDTTGPEVTVKDSSDGAKGLFRSLSVKLHDGAKVDKVEINGVVKDLTNNTWSDVNGIKPGVLGAVEGKNTLVAYDTLGNASTLEFVLDTTGPEVTVKPESLGADGLFRSVSFKLHDTAKVDGLTLNGVEKDLTNNTWSDLNGVKPGTFGAVEGDNVLVVRDALGNATTVEFVLDTNGPEITVKPESVGGDDLYRTLSVKLHDANQVDKVEINGVVKDLTNNAWSDVNGIVPGTFGAVEGDNSLVAFDVLGNSSAIDFVLDTTGPEVSTKDDTMGGDGHYRSVSFKLHDTAKVDGLTLNGVEKDLTNDVWSDLNFVKPGAFGAVEGANTLVVRDTLGNTTTVEFVLDNARPVVEITAPVAGASTSAAEVGEVRLTATDGTLLRRVAANLYKDGTFYGPIGSTSTKSALGESSWTGGWEIPTDLPAGTYTVRVGAFDLAGNWGGANVDIEIAESAVTEPGDGDTLTLDGSTVSSTTVDGIPWITFDVRLDDPAARSTGDSASLVLTDGTHTTTLELGTLVDGQLQGSVLWPGAEVAQDGAPTAFPGWSFENGSWTRSDNEFAWTLGDITATLVVNPELVVELSYPEGAGPQVTDGVEVLTPVVTDDSDSASDTDQVAASATVAGAPAAADAAGSDVASATTAQTAAELATTGSSTLWLALGAALLVAAGASVMILRRRRA